MDHVRVLLHSNEGTQQTDDATPAQSDMAAPPFPVAFPVSALARFLCSSVLLFFDLYFIFVTVLVFLRLQSMFVQLN